MKDIEALFLAIKQARRDVGCTRHNAWFRGHSSGHYKLQPGLFREKPQRKIKLEGNMFAEFKRSSPREIIGECNNSWDVLTAMQHYGIPTRMLDWTEDPLVALYFAIFPANNNSLNLASRKEADWPCIWVLNPFMLNRMAVNDNIVFDDADHIPFDYYQTVGPGFKEGLTWPHKLPIAIMPGYSNSRIRAQKGCFTCHGSDDRPVDELMRDLKGQFWHLRSFPIKPHMIKIIKKHLFANRANHSDMFPDIEGAIMQIRDRFKV